MIDSTAAYMHRMEKANPQREGIGE